MEIVENTASRLVVRRRETQHYKLGGILIGGGLLVAFLGLVVPAVPVIFIGFLTGVIGVGAMVLAKSTLLAVDVPAQTVTAEMSGLIIRRHVTYSFLEIEKIQVLQEWSQWYRSIAGIITKVKSIVGATGLGEAQPLRLKTTTLLIFAGRAPVSVDQELDATPSGQTFGPVPLAGIGPTLAALLGKEPEIIPPRFVSGSAVSLDAPPASPPAAAETQNTRR